MRPEEAGHTFDVCQHLQRLGTPMTHGRGSVVVDGLITVIVENFEVLP